MGSEAQKSWDWIQTELLGDERRTRQKAALEAGGWSA